MLSGLYIVSTGSVSIVLLIALIVINFKIITSEQTFLLKLSQFSLSVSVWFFTTSLLYFSMTFLPQDEYCDGTAVQCMSFQVVSEIVSSRHIYGKAMLLGFVLMFVSVFSISRLSKGNSNEYKL